MRQVINIENWKRKEEYLFFRTFLNPMISVTVEVDCTQAYQRAKERGVPFSMYYLHAALVAANRIEELRYRQEGEDVVLYDRIELFTPISIAGGSYRSVMLPMEEDLEVFWRKALPVVEAAKRGEGEAHAEQKYSRNFIVMSVNPWYRFSSVQLAIPQCPQENIPIFTFGKVTEENGKRMMPVALSVNHGFAGGYQISCFLKEFQQLLDR